MTSREVLATGMSWEDTREEMDCRERYIVDIDDPEPPRGTVLMAHGQTGTAWQRMHSDGSWWSTHGDQAQWSRLRRQPNLLVLQVGVERE